MEYYLHLFPMKEEEQERFIFISEFKKIFNFLLELLIGELLQNHTNNIN